MKKIGALLGGTFLALGALYPIFGQDVRNHFFETSEVKRVVTALDGSLADAAQGRASLAKVSVEVNHCRIWPENAAASVDELVTQNRQAVTTDLAGVDSTSDSEAQTLVLRFKRAMNWSQRADEKYSVWLRTRYLDRKRYKCTKSHEGAAWRAFNDRNDRAKAAKAQFLKLYNEQARKLGGIRHDWTPKEF